MKRIYFFLTIVFLITGIISVFACTKASYHKVYSTHCFLYRTTAPFPPTAVFATTPANYQATSNPPSCGTPRETLCAICFDDVLFPLVNGLPDFAGQPILNSLVQGNFNNPAKHGVQIFAPAPNQTKWVIIYFRENQ